MNWLRQVDKPLFPDMLWSRPENKRFAGKLLIIGGHGQSFNAVSEAYSAAGKAGAGAVRVIVPDKLRKLLLKLFPEAEFAPSTDIGSFSRPALDMFIDVSKWADGVLLAGDFGRNSETAVLLESFIEKYSGPSALAGDALDYFCASPLRAETTRRPNTLLIGSISQMQKMAEPNLIQQSADFIKIIEQISAWAQNIKPTVITEHSSQLITAVGDNISTTPKRGPVSNVDLAAYAIVWWLQQPKKHFEAVTSAAYQLS